MDRDDQRQPVPHTHVACYNCRRTQLLDTSRSQRCPSCCAPLHPAPAWAKAHGWPHNQVPKRERMRMHYRAPVGIKKIRFRTPKEHAIARRIEAISQFHGIRMNALLLNLLEEGLHRYEAGS